MILNKQQALKLEALIHPEIEEALILLFDITIKQSEQEVDYNPTATDIELRQLQGKKLFVKDLMDYRQRIMDAVNNNG